MNNSLHIRGLFLAFFLTILVGCAAPMKATHKTPAGPLLASVSDEGLSKWTDIGAENIQLGKSNVYVVAKPAGGFFFGGAYIMTTSVKNQKMAQDLDGSFRVELSPFVKTSLVKSSQRLGVAVPVIRGVHDETVDSQIIPLVNLTFLEDGRLALDVELKTRFLDDQGHRHNRSYAYTSPLALRYDNVSPSWVANDSAEFKKQLNRAFDVLTELMLRDRRGDFVSEMQSPNPKMLESTLGRGFTKAWLGEFKDVEVSYLLALGRPLFGVFYARDMSAPTSWQ